MFFKALAVLMAAVAGYYVLDVDPDQAAIYLMLPASTIAVIWLLGTAG